MKKRKYILKAYSFIQRKDGSGEDKYYCAEGKTVKSIIGVIFWSVTRLRKYEHVEIMKYEPLMKK